MVTFFITDALDELLKTEGLKTFDVTSVPSHRDKKLGFLGLCRSEYLGCDNGCLGSVL